jgi:hypothetical protein
MHGFDAQLSTQVEQFPDSASIDATSQLSPEYPLAQAQLYAGAPN